MLQIIVPAIRQTELWDESKEEFVPVPPMNEQTLQLEHSLISLSKWESKWCKPFYSNKEKTAEETLDYIRCMTINKKVDPRAYFNLSQKDIEMVKEYIYAPMSATPDIHESRNGRGGPSEPITSEIIYYWMITYGIPVEFEKWHLNRLITLIKICNKKNTPRPKRSTQQILRDNAAINAARRKKLNTKG